MADKERESLLRPYLRPWFLTLELVFFIFVELFQGMHGERTRVSNGVGNRGSGG